MKSNKSHGVNKDNDLNFVPLDIQEPFKFNSSTLYPILKFDGTTICTNSKDIFIGFPPLLNTPETFLVDSKNTSSIPIMPYPISIPIIESTDINEKPINAEAEDLEYQSEVDYNDMYSYNKPRVDGDYLNNIINPIDILRNYDLSEDIIDNTSRNGYTAEDINNIFKNIECNNPTILATLKTYKIPYPIAKLIIKKIIKLTLDCYKGRG